MKKRMLSASIVLASVGMLAGCAMNQEETREYNHVNEKAVNDYQKIEIPDFKKLKPLDSFQMEMNNKIAIVSFEDEKPLAVLDMTKEHKIEANKVKVDVNISVDKNSNDDGKKEVVIETEKVTEKNDSNKKETVSNAKEDSKTPSKTEDKKESQTESVKKPVSENTTNSKPSNTETEKKPESKPASKPAESKPVSKPESKPEPQKPVVEEKKPCTSHSLELTKTTVSESYQLYNYVTEHYKCKNCEYTESSDKRTGSNVSASTLNNAAAEVVSYVNSLRSKNGLNTLWTDGSWNSWAGQRANALKSNYSHNGWTHAEGNTFTLAENIASGQASAKEFYNAFLNSGTHKAAMLQPNAVGIAVAISVDSDGKTYCAMSIIGER